nr:hypothetical protein [Tanacetum cinerariifolium]
ELSWKSSEDEEVGGQEEGNESNDDSDDGSDKDSEETVKSGTGKDSDEDDDENDDDDDEEEETAKDDKETKETVKMKAMMRRSRNQDLVRRQEYEKKTQKSYIVIDEGVESIFATTSSQSVSLVPPTPILTPSTIATITTSGEAQIPPPTIPSIILENLPTFNSAFRFEERLRLLETSFNEYRQTNQVASAVAGAVSAIPGIVHQYMDQQLKEAVRETYQKWNSRRSLSKRWKEIEEHVQTTCQMEETPLPVYETGADE